MNTMKSTFGLLGLLVLGTTSCSTSHTFSVAHLPHSGRANQNLVQYARHMCGTGADGNTFPGAVVPFGMIQEVTLHFQKH